MGLAVWILLLCAVSGILSHPTNRAKWNFKREFNGLFRKSRQSTDNCRQLSEAFGDVIQQSAFLLSSAIADVQVITDEEAEQLFGWLFGFDIVNDNAAREQYTCAITQSQTLSQLKQKLEDNHFLPDIFRLMYDFGSMAVRIGKQYIPPSATLTYWNSLESVGILGLDQNRVDSLAYIINFPQYPRDYTPSAPHPGSNNAKCSHVANAYLAVINETPANASILATIKVMTGLDITDICTMRNFICDLVDGVSQGVQGLYDAYDSNGVFTSLVKNGYPYAQIYIPMARQHLEMIIREAESPTNHNRAPGDRGPTEMLDAMRSAIEFLRELEASELLGLPNDL